MKVKLFLAFCLMGAMLLLSGCESADPEEDTLPWSTPARWEQNKLPMMMPEYRD